MGNIRDQQRAHDDRLYRALLGIEPPPGPLRAPSQMARPVPASPRSDDPARLFDRIVHGGANRAAALIEEALGAGWKLVALPRSAASPGDLCNGDLVVSRALGQGRLASVNIIGADIDRSDLFRRGLVGPDRLVLRYAPPASQRGGDEEPATYVEDLLPATDVDDEAREPLFSETVRRQLAPLLDAAKVRAAVAYNAAQHPRVSEIPLASLRSALETYGDRAALVQAMGGGTPDEGALVAQLAAQFQQKCFREAVFHDGKLNEQTLDALGFVRHRGRALNRADEGSAGALALIRRAWRSGLVNLGSDVTADSWFSFMVDAPFLGLTTRYRVGIHLELLRRLRRAQRHLMSQSKYENRTPAELGDLLFWRSDDGPGRTKDLDDAFGNRHRGNRRGAVTTPMHFSGLAVDLAYRSNPWIGNASFKEVTERAARAAGETSASGLGRAELSRLGSSGRLGTGEIYDEIAKWNDWLRRYMAGTDRQVRADKQLLQDSGGFLSGRDPARGFLSLQRDLVIALRDHGCLAWGGCDFGGGSGDLMHFDCRVDGIGRAYLLEHNKGGGTAGFVPDVHPCRTRPPTQPTTREDAYSEDDTKPKPAPRPKWTDVPLPGVGGKLHRFKSKQTGSITAVYVPPAAQKNDPLNVLVWMHGDLICCEELEDASQLLRSIGFPFPKQLFDSGKPFVLVAPSLGSGEAGYRAAIGEPKAMNAFLEEVRTGLVDAGWPSTPAPDWGQIILAGHSRAYRILNPLAEAVANAAWSTGALAKVSNIWALDITYATKPETRKWACDVWTTFSQTLDKKKRDLEVRFEYLKNSATSKLAECIRDAAATNKLKNLKVAGFTYDPETTRLVHCSLPRLHFPNLLASIVLTPPPAPKTGGAGQPTGARLIEETPLIEADLERDDVTERAPALTQADARWAADADSPDHRHLLPESLSTVPFAFTPRNLETLCALNRFLVPDGTPILFALRACTLEGEALSTGWAPSVRLVEATPDHLNARCVLGVWDRTGGRLIAFKGSTLPFWSSMERYRQGGEACNMLGTGLHRFAIGTHRAGDRLEIKGAFKEQEAVVVLRTLDDLVYTVTDVWDGRSVGDNVHPARHSGLTPFSSEGCLTVPGEYNKGTGRHSGAWTDFRKAAGLTADAAPARENGRPFVLVLLTGREARLVGSLANPARALTRLRFGSRGDDVVALQQGLATTGHYRGRKTGLMDVDTTLAYIRWQQSVDGGRADAIVTNDDARALGVDIVRGQSIKPVPWRRGAPPADGGLDLLLRGGAPPNPMSPAPPPFSPAPTGQPAPVAPAGGKPLFTLAGSVGRGGRNAPADVAALKDRLIALGFNWLKPGNAIARPTDDSDDTIHAIRLFQSIVAGKSPLAGDGRVDVPGTTYEWLQAVNAPHWQTMPAGSAAEGFDNVELRDTADNHDFGTDWLADTIRAAGVQYRDGYRRAHPTAALLTVNDVSKPRGGPTPDHPGLTHESGLACDLRLPRTDGTAPGDTTWRTSNYDRDAARGMIQALRAQTAHTISRVFFNDPVLIKEGLSQEARGHDNHIHFQITQPARGTPALAPAPSSPGTAPLFSESAPPGPGPTGSSGTRASTRTPRPFRVIDLSEKPLAGARYALYQDSLNDTGALDAQGEGRFVRVDPARPFRLQVEGFVCAIAEGAVLQVDEPGVEYGGQFVDWHAADAAGADQTFWRAYAAERQAAAQGPLTFWQHDHLTRRPLVLRSSFLTGSKPAVFQAAPVRMRLGPLVRFVDEKRALIWAELETPGLVRVRFGKAADQKRVPRPGQTGAPASSQARHVATVRVGGRHFALVRVDGLDPDTVYQYTIDLAPFPAVGVIPRIESEFTPEAFPQALPPDVVAAQGKQLAQRSFRNDRWLQFRTLAGDYERLRFAHGSCRIWPGDTGPDGRPLAPDMLDLLGSDWMARQKILSEWPLFLLHTGDQIYADDIGVKTGERILSQRFGSLPPGPRTRAGLSDGAWAGRFADRYVGVEPTRMALEAAPVQAQAKRLAELESLVAQARQKGPLDAATLKLVGEYTNVRRALDQQSNFDRTLRFVDATRPMRYRQRIDNALLWRIPVEKKALPEVTRLGLRRRDRDRSLYPSAGDTNAVHAADFLEYSYLYECAWSTPGAAKVLAHVPSFMIFDDHDVTDDWNFDAAWADMVHDSGDLYQMWPKTITDALAAYWMYQGWGNVSPDLWGSDPRIRVLHAARAEGRDALPELRALIFERATKPARPDAPAGGRLIWHYALPLRAPQFLVIDGRTERELYGPGGPFVTTQLPWLAKRLEEARASAAFIVFPTPFLMPHPLSWAFTHQEFVRILSSIKGWKRLSIEELARSRDLEHAAGNRVWNQISEILGKLQDTVTPLKTLALLSGDVHFSCNLDGQFDKGQVVPPHLLQLISSGFLHRLSDENRGLLDAAYKYMGFKVAGTHRELKVRLGGLDGPGRDDPNILFRSSVALVDVDLRRDPGDARIDGDEIPNVAIRQQHLTANPTTGQLESYDFRYSNNERTGPQMTPGRAA